VTTLFVLDAFNSVSVVSFPLVLQLSWRLILLSVSWVDCSLCFVPKEKSIEKAADTFGLSSNYLHKNRGQWRVCYLFVLEIYYNTKKDEQYDHGHDNQFFTRKNIEDPPLGHAVTLSRITTLESKCIKCRMHKYLKTLPSM
jgi:hypothetical protein